MVKISKVEKFLKALYDAGGELARSELAIRVFARNWSAAQLDELLAAPQLQELVTVTRAPKRSRNGKGDRKYPRGRVATLYSLTGSGWALLRSGLRVGVQPFRINSEECQRQFALLVADRDPWALELSRQATVGREHEAQEQRKREEAREARQKALNALPKHPSAKRKRSQKELQQREAWFAAKTGKVLIDGKWRDPEGISAAPRTIAPADPAPVPVATIAPTVAPSKPAANPNDDFRRAVDLSRVYVPVSSVAPRDSQSQPRSTLDPKAAALLGKIAAAGYTVKGGMVLYGGNWISPEQWRERMPHVEL